MRFITIILLVLAGSVLHSCSKKTNTTDLVQTPAQELYLGAD
jgi:hypothetical protein